MRCFRHTFDELHKIFFGLSKNISKLSYVGRPGDALEYCRKRKYAESDILPILDNLVDRLKQIGIEVVEKPFYDQRFAVNERLLEDYIRTNCNYVNDDAMLHDLDSVTAIYRLRGGRTEKYLEACRYIFVTSNSALARGALSFFITEENDTNQGNAPLCMGDHVFTTYVWLKSVKKVPDIPKRRLVSASLAALNPRGDIWARYVAEVKKLREGSTISQDDAHILLNSIDARRYLMDDVMAREEPITEGSVEEILLRVKDELAVENARVLTEQTEEHDSEKAHLFAAIHDLKSAVSAAQAGQQRELRIRESELELSRSNWERNFDEQERRITELTGRFNDTERATRSRVEAIVAATIWVVIYAVLCFALAALMIYSNVNDLSKLTDGKFAEYGQQNFWVLLGAFILVAIGVLNLLNGFNFRDSLSRPIKRLVSRIADSVISSN